MSQDNVDVVRGIYEAWARDEYPGPEGSLDPDVEYVNPAGAIEPGTRRGLDAFREANEKVLESWAHWRMEPEEFRAVGDDRVAVVVAYRARGRASGVEVEGRESALWTLSEGRVVRYEWFHGPQDALDAVGPAG